ncbi:hypothetical protein JX265_001942 [Neoarthrinium moseri]|uniref:Uncharacterized protein n=1 Tax=Neoarthrinium moseri TaxID=1658444 RepID=A0A9Q0AVL4_9PEZI|nr:hypothetical protein JX265_001942 [Neoarthrinium moseri]
MDSPPAYREFEAPATSVGGVMRSNTAAPRLPQVVILPQRRPKQRQRGFVRAYAPDLIFCGIDQATFLAFIDGLNAAVSSNPFGGSLNAAGQVIGIIPASVASFAPITGMSLQIAAEIYNETQARISQNSYLRKMNDELFRPRGLYCLIMAYDTNSRHGGVRGDAHCNTDNLIPEETNQVQDIMCRFRSTDGAAGDANFPASAALIYCEPKDPVSEEHSEGAEDSAASSSAKGGMRSIAGKLAKVAAAYDAREDLKSQVKFQRKHPTSLINPLLDPSAELSEKDLRKQQKKEAEQQKKWEKQARKDEKRLRKHPEKEPREHKVRESILYLMIVNMPSVEEMNNARALVGPRQPAAPLEELW